VASARPIATVAPSSGPERGSSETTPVGAATAASTVVVPLPTAGSADADRGAGVHRLRPIAGSIDCVEESAALPR